jgi:VanZ family protein
MLGGLIEIIQEAFFKPRSSEWVDWLADIFGILTAWGIMSLLKNRTKYF